jgi:hypothetical protein
MEGLDVGHAGRKYQFRVVVQRGHESEINESAAMGTLWPRVTHVDHGARMAVFSAVPR